MERLNDIMGRTAQRRHHYSEQRSPMQHQQGQQGQRPPQAQLGQQQTSARPPLREQNARQGQQRPYVPQGQPTPATRIQQEPTGYEGRSYAAPPVARPVSSRPVQQPNQAQRPAMNRSTAYQPQRSERQPVLDQQVAHPLQTRPVHVYHHADEYALSPVMQADVVGAREDEEDEETGMQYGDWEEGENEVVIYQRPTPEPQTRARGMVPTQPNSDYVQPYPQHPLVTRELARPSNTGTQAYTTRNLRDVQQVQPPTPPTRAQEVQHHRMTQPLDPHIVTEAGRARYVTQGQAQVQQRPLHQIVPQRAQVHEQAVMPFASASLPPVAPLAPIKSACPRCKGAGYLRANVPFGHPNFGKPIACACKEAEKKEKRRQQLLELSDLGAFRTKSFTNFSTHFPGMHPTIQEAFEIAQDYAQDPYGWLLLVGPNGCGKTHLAAAIANICLDSGSVVLFAVVPDLLAHLRSAFAPTAPEGYDQLFAKMREAELLVLDDLGSHQSSPWASEKLFQLLNYRYNSHYPTVITANKGGLGSIDDRVLSRLSDVSLVNSVVMDGAQDYRRRNPRRD
ncbi:MAG: hypothetical protein NVS4B11_31610 [Ktedonobacteraceae bacterium]